MSDISICDNIRLFLFRNKSIVLLCRNVQGTHRIEVELKSCLVSSVQVSLHYEHFHPVEQRALTHVFICVLLVVLGVMNVVELVCVKVSLMNTKLPCPLDSFTAQESLGQNTPKLPQSHSSAHQIRTSQSYLLFHTSYRDFENENNLTRKKVIKPLKESVSKTPKRSPSSHFIYIISKCIREVKPMKKKKRIYLIYLTNAFWQLLYIYLNCIKSIHS